MDPRYIFSALAGLFAAVVIFATVTTVRHISHRSAGSQSFVPADAPSSGRSFAGMR